MSTSKDAVVLANAFYARWGPQERTGMRLSVESSVIAGMTDDEQEWFFPAYAELVIGVSRIQNRLDAKRRKEASDA